MKKNVLLTGVALCLGMINESWAETWNCGPKDEQGNYGDSVKCVYDETTKTMTVSGKGNMGNYDYFLDENNQNSSSAPWFGKPIENIVIGDGVTSVGAKAFAFNDSLKSVSGMKDVERFGSMAFNLDYGVDSFVIPEKIKYIGDNALQSINGLSGQVFVLPDTLKVVGIDALKFGGTYIISEDLDTSNWVIGAFGNGTLNIICKGSLEKCQSNISKFIKKTEGGNGTCEKEGFCNGSFSVVSANSEQCTGNYGWNGANCVKKDAEGNVTCASGFVEWDNACVDEYPFAKKRWTPAEANEWLHDGNDNFVIITFKK